jgi:hypothetical protein
MATVHYRSADVDGQRLGPILRLTGIVVGTAAGLVASWQARTGLLAAVPGCRLAAWALIRGERSSGLRTGVCACS